jgi:hypothetical protein
LGDAGGGFTVAYYMKFGSTSATQDIFNEMWDGADEYGDDHAGDTKTKFLHLDPTGVIYGRVWDGTTSAQVATTGTTPVGTTNYRTVVMRWDSATLTVSLFLDGVAEGTPTVASNPRRVRVTDGFTWWPYRSLILPLVSARVKEQAYWNRPLSDSEIADLHDVWSGASPPPPPPPAGAPGDLSGAGLFLMGW